MGHAGAFFQGRGLGGKILKIVIREHERLKAKPGRSRIISLRYFVDHKFVTAKSKRGKWPKIFGGEDFTLGGKIHPQALWKKKTTGHGMKGRIEMTSLCVHLYKYLMLYFQGPLGSNPSSAKQYTGMMERFLGCHLHNIKYVTRSRSGITNWN